NQSQNQKNKKLHFVGLGSGGTNVAVHIYKQGVKAKLTGINGFYSSYIPLEMNFIEYQTRTYNPEKPYIDNIALTDEMKKIFDADDYFIILTGLGHSVGTGLISETLDLLRAKNKKYLAICSMPFPKEGRSINNRANEKMLQIEALSNVYFFRHQSIIENEGEMRISSLFARGNELVYEILKEKCPFL
ncbi:MAG: hypothetical protein Q8862_13475, partial [Bacteroidota bacterium]|nr:hypothetical protein [Bacteroidota bacterium]